MPKKYHIEPKPASTRHTVPGRASLIDWEEGCLRCTVCVKQKCVYGAYDNRQIDPVSLTDTLDMLCKHCYQCVQGCPNRLISKSVNPEYEMMGNDYWTPAILSTLYYQAELGKIPVSGAGYTGPFTGPGFDSMWTDMSEIVRPTRDGIHGREYISTATDIGTKASFLVFDEDGNLTDGHSSSYVDLPTPIIYSLPEGLRNSDDLYQAMLKAAKELETLLMVPAGKLDLFTEADFPHLIPILSQDDLWADQSAYRRFRIVEIEYFDGIDEWIKVFNQDTKNGVVLSVRLPSAPGVEDLVQPLVEAGAGVIHMFADANGRETIGSIDGAVTPHLVDSIRRVHLKIVDHGRRDTTTLIVSGGIALAEHVAKAIICGADAVIIDTALWVALECRVCDDCQDLLECPVNLENAPLEWAKQRLVNLSVAWHNQILEVLGAMGIREIRRLRGEVGRAMFFNQLEEESFAPIFGQRKV